MQNIDHNVWARHRGYRLTHAAKLLALASTIILATLILALIIVTMVKQYTVTHLARYQQELTQEVSELDTLNNQKKLCETDAKQLDQRWAKVQKITCSEKNNPYLYLQKLSKIIPDQVALTTFNFGRTNIRLEGIATNVPEVTKFMGTLAKSGIFTLPKLVTLDRKKQSHVHFMIDAAKHG